MIEVRKRHKEQEHIASPFYLEDEEGTVRAEGICCRKHAQVMALALNDHLEKTCRT